MLRLIKPFYLHVNLCTESCVHKAHLALLSVRVGFHATHWAARDDPDWDSYRALRKVSGKEINAL